MNWISRALHGTLYLGLANTNQLTSLTPILQHCQPSTKKLKATLLGLYSSALPSTAFAVNSRFFLLIHAVLTARLISMEVS